MSGLSFEYILEHDSGEPHCSERTREMRATEIEYITYADHYAEPGYDDPKRAILFGNWNNFSKRVYDILERAGYELEWSDEWDICGECGKAVRSSPDSYSWTPYYVLSDGDLTCLDCIDWAEYLESIEDDGRKTCMSACNPAEYGYKLLEQDLQNGFHPGQTDDPREILKRLQAEGKTGIVFRISGVGQFDMTFEVWQKIQEEDNDNEATND